MLRELRLCIKCVHEADRATKHRISRLTIETNLCLSWPQLPSFGKDQRTAPTSRNELIQRTTPTALSRLIQRTALTAQSKLSTRVRYTSHTQAS